MLTRRWLIVRVKDFRFRPNELPGLAMAVEAPGHVESASAIRERHFGNRAMTSGAADPFIHVNAMVEIDEIGQRIDAGPLQGDIVAIAGANRFEHARIGPNLRMAGHAGVSGRQTGEGGFFDRGVAIAAVDAQFAGVMAMAKRNGLLTGNILIGVPG